MVGRVYSDHGGKPSHEDTREYPDFSERIKPQPGAPDAGVRADTEGPTSSTSSSEAKRKSASDDK